MSEQNTQQQFPQQPYISHGNSSSTSNTSKQPYPQQPYPQQPYPQQPYPQQPYQQFQPQPKKKRKWVKWVVIGALVLFLFSVIAGGGNDEGSSSAPVGVSSAQQAPEMTVSAQQMLDDLTANALGASNTYKDKVVTVTGYVGTIDSSGAYFSVDPSPDALVLTSVQAKPKTDEARNTLATLTKGSPVTVTGKVTGVGEVLGISIDAQTVAAG